MQDHPAEAFRTAIALIRHVRRRDEAAVAALVIDAAPDPDAAARLIIGLAGVSSALLDALPATAAERLLDETLTDLARAEGAKRLP